MGRVSGLPLFRSFSGVRAPWHFLLPWGAINFVLAERLVFGRREMEDFSKRPCKRIRSARYGEWFKSKSGFRQEAMQQVCVWRKGAEHDAGSFMHIWPKFRKTSREICSGQQVCSDSPWSMLLFQNWQEIPMLERRQKTAASFSQVNKRASREEWLVCFEQISQPPINSKLRLLSNRYYRQDVGFQCSGKNLELSSSGWLVRRCASL